MADAFDNTKDYTKTGDTYDRENYKAYLTALSQDVLVKVLADTIVGSKLVLTNWEKDQLAENLAEIRFGKIRD